MYVVAASAHTSVAMPLRGGSANDSGGDHGMDMPSARAASSTVDEMPKSVSAGCPYSVTRMFAGLMSRCRIPARCAVSTAPAIWTAVRSASATESRSVRYRAPRLGREQYSMARYGRPSSAMSASYIVTIDGCVDSVAMRSASASNAARCEWLDHSCSRTLTATRRRGRCCW